MIYRGKQYTLIIFGVEDTLTRPKSGGPTRENAADWQWLPGRKERLLAISEETHLAIVTNIDLHALKGSEMIIELTRMAAQARIPMRSVGYSLGENTWSLPAPDMLLAAMKLEACTSSETLMVGTNPDDQGAAQAASCNFVLAEEFFAVL